MPGCQLGGYVDVDIDTDIDTFYLSFLALLYYIYYLFLDALLKEAGHVWSYNGHTYF